MLDSADAAEYLTSAMKGYQVAVEDVAGIVLQMLCQEPLAEHQSMCPILRQPHLKHLQNYETHYPVIATGISNAAIKLNEFNAALKMVKVGNLGENEIAQLSKMHCSLRPLRPPLHQGRLALLLPISVCRKNISKQQPLQRR